MSVDVKAATSVHSGVSWCMRKDDVNGDFLLLEVTAFSFLQYFDIVYYVTVKDTGSVTNYPQRVCSF